MTWVLVLWPRSSRRRRGGPARDPTLSTAWERFPLNRPGAGSDPLPLLPQSDGRAENAFRHEDDEEHQQKAVQRGVQPVNVVTQSQPQDLGEQQREDGADGGA